MQVQIDFSLNQYFGVVEKTIFRVVLNGLTSTEQISKLLWIFSDTVIANALRNLVNQQILKANLDTQTIDLSDSFVALTNACIGNSVDIIIPSMLDNEMMDESLFITDTKVKEVLLNHLVPDFNLDFFAKSLDFYIKERGDSYE